MDARLAAWARAVKARRAKAGLPFVPPLWLFTDPVRLADPREAVARLPRGLAGVVLRGDGAPGRAALARDIAGICRARRLLLSVAGDWRLAAAHHAGVHARGGHRPAGMTRGLRLLTASVHDRADAVRARRGGVAVAFISPVFPTRSHPGARPLGPARWAVLANWAGQGRAAALGGIDTSRIRRLPLRLCRAAGAIGALR